MWTDPKTQAWLKSSIDPAFGFPGLARFSWATVKVMLENDAHSVKWCSLNFIYPLVGGQVMLTEALR